MSFLGHSRRLLSPVFKSRVLPEQTGVLRSVCPLHTARLLRSRCSARLPAAQSPPCQRWRHVFTCRSDTDRCFSEVCGDSGHSTRRAGVLEEEAHEMERDSKSPQTFTLDMLVSLLRQENAVDICVIKVPEQIKYTEYFIVASGVSPRHLRAMALYAVKVYKFLKKDGDPNVKIEGKDAEDWMCIDFGNMVAHFMLPETREVYELEKLWTLRAYDEQLKSMPVETLPEDFIYDVEITK